MGLALSLFLCFTVFIAAIFALFLIVYLNELKREDKYVQEVVKYNKEIVKYNEYTSATSPKKATPPALPKIKKDLN